ncbi:hypothetical protein ACF0H5_011011 [Mactra antiquata]
MAEGKYCVNVERFCEPCLCDHLEVSAVSFCILCTEYMCSDCTKSHRRNKVTRNHTTLEGDDLPNDSAVFVLMKKLTNCSDHPDVPLTFKCQDHKIFICTSCLVSKHRKCDNVSEISNSPDDNDETPTQESLVERIVKLKDKTASTISSKVHNIETIRSDETQIMQKQKQAVEEMHKYFRKLLEESKNETKIIAAREVKVLSDDIKALNILESKEKETNDLLLTTKEHGTKTECRIINKIVAEDIGHLESKVDESNTAGEVKLIFKENDVYKRIKSIGNTTKDIQRSYPSVDEMKKLTQAVKHSSDTFDESEKSPFSQSAKMKEMKGDIKAEQQRKPHRSFLERQMKETNLEYNIRVPSDEGQCQINRILILNDKTIVLSDTKNKNIKVFDINFSHIATYYLKYSPSDMCIISNYLLAVACRKRKKVLRIFVGEGQLTCDDEFCTKLYPVSLCTLEDKKIVILLTKTEKDDDEDDKANHSIQIRHSFNPFGRIIVTLDIFLSKRDATLKLVSPKRVEAAKQMPDCILIAERNILYCFQINECNLKEIWFVKSHSDVHIYNITDVVMDSKHNCYVCCNNSYRIIQVPATNYMKNKVLSQIPTHPLSMAIDENGCKIYICSEDSNFVRVYDFC